MRLLARFPVTILLALQYGIFVLMPALDRSGSDVAWIMSLLAPALLASVVVEAALLPLGNARSTNRSAFVTFSGAIVVTVIGFMALGLAAYYGAGTYGSQIGTSSTGTAAALFTPLRSWTVIGPALVLYLAKRGEVSRATALTVVGIASTAMLAQGLYAGFISPFATYVFAFAFAVCLCGLVKARWVLAGTVIAVLVWPYVHELRNEARIEQGALPARYAYEDPSDRLDMDVFMLTARGFAPGSDLGEPSVLEVARFGLVPRALDPDRPDLSTGQVINRSLGGSPATSSTFTVLANVYVLAGWWEMLVYVAAVSLALGICVRSRGPFAFVLGIAMVQHLLWIESVFPDSVANLLQTGALTLVAFAAMRALSLAAPRARGAGRQRPVLPRAA